ncbi:MAG: endonuclease/exonuclease/phosphatase family protein [Anaerolineae bacterium]
MTTKTATLRQHSARLLRFVLSLYAISTLIITVLLFFALPDNAVFAFIRTGYIIGLVPSALIALALSVSVKQTHVSLLIAPNALIALFTLAPYMIPVHTTPQPDAPMVRVLSYNLDNTDDHTILDAHADLIRETQPDIIAFQELSQQGHDRLQDRIAQDYPYMVVNLPDEWWKAGQGVYSKYPILEEVLWVDEDVNMMHRLQEVVLDIASTEVAFYNVHPYPPIEWQGGLRFVVNPDEVRTHSIALHRIITRVELETMPVILAGDLNMSQQFPEYRRLANILSDSERWSGSGVGLSYPANNIMPALIRLDYIFHSDEWRTVQARVLPDTNTSDHRAVMATLILDSQP